MASVFHTPVLLNEVLGFLLTSRDGKYIDATAGGGGHAETILNSLSQEGTLFCFDRDPSAVDYLKKRLTRFDGRVVIIHDIYSEMNARMEQHGTDKVAGILLDLGISSFQLESDDRGFAYSKDVPLDMRMDPGIGVDAARVVNSYSEKELADIFYKFGEERRSRIIARKIAEYRRKKKITRSKELAEIVESVTGQRFLTKSLSRIFQALRIEVNRELEHLESGLQQAYDLLNKGGRLVAISYHSLEDRIVKNFFRNNDGLKKLTKKPVVPSEEELKHNPRARSAKLRAAERV